ncbi:MAG: protein-L-isoaspartate(D-aspartate) O-methyltransferase [Deltaproteobacteria bacterium]|nr:protein-L-isoaspartate(D-aspartate) O-methyltransferase [Deltaproteobacteria bacterium]MBI2342217.1 protein-L-isoaspartate(D-aspartate) O-methyltransferase [Deltaproteobacteria bacterium]MBI2974998.1 protein-L-isoaspartate(D-aspartate) O-methyltransferase [Deltaproteobacteria bacterium]
MSRHDAFKKRGLTDDQNSYYIARKRMIEEQLKPAIRDPLVIEAMSKVPRHKFIEGALVDQAYSDYPLNIGEGQTISQPLIVAMMTEALQLKGTEKVLEIGTGSGYQTAILCELAKHVYSVERIGKLSNRARRVLYDLSYVNFTLRVGDGTNGWSEAAPFDRIIVTAGAPAIPKPLLMQLADGGMLVIPVGNEESQMLKIVTKEGASYREKDVSGCRFVKLIGEYGWRVE